MKKILFIIPSLKVGGAERMMERLIDGLCNKWDCTVAYLEQAHIGENIVFPPQVRLVKLPTKKTRYAYFSIFKLIKNHNPDVVFSSWSRSNLLLLNIKLFLPDNIKVVIREPNLPSFSLPVVKQYKIYQILYKIFYRRASLIICQSKQMKQELMELFTVPEAKIHIVHNMLSVSEIQIKSEELSMEFAINRSDVLACGRLASQKGFDILIESFASVVAQNPTSRLIILGEGKERANLEARVVILNLQNCVLMPGNVSNPYKYMKQCGVFVSSSRWEGLPNTVLEAMACGANIVAMDCPGATSEIIEHGMNGWLVPVKDTNQLALAINNVLNGNNRLNINNIKSYAKKYDISTILPQYDNLLNSTV